MDIDTPSKTSGRESRYAFVTEEDDGSLLWGQARPRQEVCVLQSPEFDRVCSVVMGRNAVDAPAQ